MQDPKPDRFANLYEAGRRAAQDGGGAATRPSLRRPTWIDASAGAAVAQAPGGLADALDEWGKWSDNTEAGVKRRAQEIYSDPAGASARFVRAYRGLPVSMQEKFAGYYADEREVVRSLARKRQLMRRVVAEPTSAFLGVGEIGNFFGVASGIKDKIEGAVGGYLTGDYDDVDDSGAPIKVPFSQGETTHARALEEASDGDRLFRALGVKADESALLEKLADYGTMSTAAGAARVLGENVGVAKAFGWAAEGLQSAAGAATLTGRAAGLGAKAASFLAGGSGGAAGAVGQQLGYGGVSRFVQGVSAFHEQTQERLANLVIADGETPEQARARVNSGWAATKAGLANAGDVGGVVHDAALGLAFYGIGRGIRGAASKLAPAGVFESAASTAIDRQARVAFGTGASLATKATAAGRSAGAWLGRRGVEGLVTGIEFSLGTSAIEGVEHLMTGQGRAPWDKDEFGLDPLARTLAQGIVGFSWGVMFGKSPLTRGDVKAQRPKGAAERLDWYRKQTGPDGRRAIDVLQQQAPNAEAAVDVMDAVYEAASNPERAAAIKAFGESVSEAVANEAKSRESLTGQQSRERLGAQRAEASAEGLARQRLAESGERARLGREATASVGEQRDEQIRVRERLAAAMDRPIGTDKGDVRAAYEIADPDVLWDTAQMLREAGQPADAAAIEKAVDLLTRGDDLTTQEQQELGVLTRRMATLAAPDARRRLAEAVTQRRARGDAAEELAALQTAIRSTLASGGTPTPAQRGRAALLEKAVQSGRGLADVRPMQREPYAPRPRPRPRTTLDVEPAAQAEQAEPQAGPRPLGGPPRGRPTEPPRRAPTAAPKPRPQQPEPRRPAIENLPPRSREELAREEAEFARRRAQAEADRVYAEEIGRLRDKSESEHAESERVRRTPRQLEHDGTIYLPDDHAIIGRQEGREPEFDAGRRRTVESAIAAEREVAKRRKDEDDSDAAAAAAPKPPEPTTPSERAAKTPARAAQDAAREAAERLHVPAKGASVEWVDPSTLERAPGDFQMRTNADAKTGDARRVGEPYKLGRGGVWTVWESKDGKRYVAHGHNRLGAWERTDPARRPERVPVVVLREADGVTKEMARVEAMLDNLAGDTLEPVEAAKAIREGRVTGRVPAEGDLRAFLKSEGVAPKLIGGGKVGAAADLTELSPMAFDDVERGALTVPQARELAKLRNRYDAQDTVLRAVRESQEALGRELTPAEVNALARTQESAEQGAVPIDPREARVAVAVGEIIDAVRRGDAAVRSAMSSAQRNAGLLETTGSKIDAAGVGKALATARDRLDTLDKLGRRSSMLARMLHDAGEALSESPSQKSAIVGRTAELLAVYDPVRDAFPEGAYTPTERVAVDEGGGLFDVEGEAATPVSQQAPQLAPMPTGPGGLEAVQEALNGFAAQVVGGKKGAGALKQATAYVEDLPPGPVRAYAVGYLRELIDGGKFGRRARPKV